jgi:hypothetical protein
MGKMGKQFVNAETLEALGKDLNALAERCDRLRDAIGDRVPKVEGLGGTNEFKIRTANFLSKIESFLAQPVPLKAAEPPGVYSVSPSPKGSKHPPGKKSGRPKKS